VPTDSLTDARLYSLLHVGNEGDVDFYQRLCAGVDSVLELGSGWGRLLGPLVEVGCAVTGVEVDAGMRGEAQAHLATWAPAKRAKVELLAGDMRTLELGRTFDRVLVPYCGLYCLADDAEVVAVLKRLAAHLNPDGLLVFDGYHIPDPEWIEGGLGDFDHLTTLEEGATRVEVYELDEHVPERCDCKVSYRFEVHAPDAPVRTVLQVIDHHYLVADRVQGLLEAAGLTLLGRWGSFDGAPLDEDAEQMIIVAGPIEAGPAG
jgi:SAM-dependent methyltransferase